jgi:multidrug efflux pump subunit AcrA (membrane-fusion protein)
MRFAAIMRRRLAAVTRRIRPGSLTTLQFEVNTTIRFTPNDGTEGRRDDATGERCLRPHRGYGRKAAQIASTVEVARVIEKPVDVTLSMPGQLDPFETVAVYPRVTGFVTSLSVDRGSRVRAGDVMALLEAPELSAQRAEAQSKLQVANSQLAVDVNEVVAGGFQHHDLASRARQISRAHQPIVSGTDDNGGQLLSHRSSLRVPSSRAAGHAVSRAPRLLRAPP